ncbi:MAG TPA: hypothetical protein VF052_04995 [Solirubrobacterales bacterium]
MKKLIPGRPSPAMIVAVIALVFALTGAAYAATIGLSDLTKKAKDKTVGVGKLTYVSTTTSIPPLTGDELRTVSANCPGGLRPIGGGIKLEPNDADVLTDDSYPTSAGWTGTVFNGNSDPANATVTVACAVSRVVTGSAPNS